MTQFKTVVKNAYTVVKFIFIILMFISAKKNCTKVSGHYTKLKHPVPHRVHGAGNRLQLSSDSCFLFLVRFLVIGSYPATCQSLYAGRNQSLCLTVLVEGALYRDCN